MSDPMTNSEIEDVLSSIRRLVSQEGTRVDRPGDGDAAHVSRLVLTEAQRIAPVPQSPDIRALETTIAELEAAVSATDALLDADVVDAPTAMTPALDPAAEAGAGPSAGEAVDSGAEMVADMASGSNVTALYGRLSFIHREMHGLRDTAAPAVSVDAQAVTAQLAEVASVYQQDGDPRDGEIQSPEPDETRPVPGLRLNLAEAGADETAAQVGADLGADDAAARFGADDIAETIIDEDMLRALVAQLVREELRGQLGEKITHQVRKLVRAEIGRVLDERNLI